MSASAASTNAAELATSAIVTWSGSRFSSRMRCLSLRAAPRSGLRRRLNRRALFHPVARASTLRGGSYDAEAAPGGSWLPCRGARSSLVGPGAELCWESLALLRGEGVFRPPERRPAGLSGRLLALPPRGIVKERRARSNALSNVSRCNARHSRTGGKAALIAWGSDAAAGLTPPHSPEVGRLPQGRRARRAATHRRRILQNSQGRTRGRERRGRGRRTARARCGTR